MKHSLKTLAAALAAVLVLSGGARAETTRLIDTPTTGLLNYGAYDLSFRLFSDGGILTRLDFGVFKIVNLGVGWEVSNVIGSQSVVVGPPALFLKIKAYNGDMVLPSIAIGYDGQGYFYNKDLNEFTQKEKGLFLVFGREILFPGLEVNLGANMNDFKKSTVFGFVNADLNIEDKAHLMVEYDRINYFPDTFLNAGIRFPISDGLTIDLAGRDIGSGRPAERILRINYLGKF